MSAEIVFALRGAASPYSARYGRGGLSATPVGSNWISSSPGGLSGTVINLNNLGGPQKFLSYVAPYNIPNSASYSILIRMAPNWTTAPSGWRNFWSLTGGLNPYIEFRQESVTSNMVIACYNDWNNQALSQNATFGAWTAVTAGVYYDIVFLWDGTTAANAAKLYIDGTLLGSETPVAVLGQGITPTNTFFKNIVLGCGVNSAASEMLVDEFVIWDGLIDPTNVMLESGPGSLDGAARTSLVLAPIFGGPQTYSRGRAVNG